MSWSYRKLWHTLIENRMKKTDLIERAEISANILAKMGKDEPIAMVSLGKICEALSCDVGDIVEWIPDSQEENGIDPAPNNSNQH